MAGKLQRPILVGGIGLSAMLALWEGLDRTTGDRGEWGILGAIAVGTGAWLLRPRAPELDLSPIPIVVDRTAVDKAIAKTQATLDGFVAETDKLETPHPEATASIFTFAEALDRLKSSLDRTEMQIAVVGGKSTGKTSVGKVLESAWEKGELKCKFVETPFGSEETTSLPTDLNADLVLFLVTGDITAPEFQAIEQLRAAGYKTLLVWNKEDQCPTDDRAGLLQQLQSRMQGLVDAENVVAIAASPAPVKVRKHQADESVKERLEAQTPQIEPLTQRLESILVGQEMQKLVFASTLRQAKALQGNIKQQLNQLRRDRALPIMTQYQWIAAAAALANPVPALDLLATGAVSGQLVMDLGEIYQQKFSLEQAKVTAASLGGLMVKLGLVELSTQTISAMLKTNAVTYLAGGAVQGISAAYLTRIVGLSLIEYFQQQDVAIDGEKGLNLEKLTQIVQGVFQENQRTAFVRSFVTQALDRLSPKLKPNPNSEIAASH
ncbi:DUF697 domain-containing protein [Oscillatoriales cyanobacterium LEGE 11467]|uniref:DUF697 domain-containing protein n=1 Tax=Zarconia navalis LEGE 11467 TaxID=1828826 RepID=A0A928W0E6_9CYAN|nr:DUF697 domain-containing protein [Zarconia navalis]MBE9042197.1 DUF697 domain-containing protein [Zarconia navalis LEGE 11467]